MFETCTKQFTNYIYIYIHTDTHTHTHTHDFHVNVNQNIKSTNKRLLIIKYKQSNKLLFETSCN